MHYYLGIAFHAFVQFEFNLLELVQWESSQSNLEIYLYPHRSSCH